MHVIARSSHHVAAVLWKVSTVLQLLSHVAVNPVSPMNWSAGVHIHQSDSSSTDMLYQNSIYPIPWDKVHTSLGVPSVLVLKNSQENPSSGSTFNILSIFLGSLHLLKITISWMYTFKGHTVFQSFIITNISWSRGRTVVYFFLSNVFIGL